MIHRHSWVRSALLGFFFISPLFSIHAYAESVLDIGTDYRMRGISLSKTDYGADGGQNFAYYSQRAEAHVGARFSPNIEMMTQFQALGVVGSSTSAIPYNSVDPTGGRYPNTTFTPWVQWAYLKASQIYDMPVDVTVGRQPITLGDGFLLSDDDLGLTGIRIQSKLPIYDLQADAFTFKTADAFQGNADADIYGLQLTKPFQSIRYQAMVLSQRDATGNAIFVRPSENPDNPASLPAGIDLHASRITRTFYDGRVEGRLLEGGFFKSELALQQGNVVRSSSTLQDVKLGGYAFLLSGGLFTRFSKYGPIEIHGTFGMASGDSGGSTDDAFQPGFGHKFDGLERSGFGEYYGATLYDAVPSSGSPTGLPAGYSGIRVIGAGVTTHPTALLSIGIDYYVYTAEESPGSSFVNSSSDSSLGTELDVGAGFAYTNYLSFRASFALFQPGSAYANRQNATRVLIEATGHF